MSFSMSRRKVPLPLRPWPKSNTARWYGMCAVGVESGGFLGFLVVRGDGFVHY
jgi:hypothetical protein